MKKHDGFRDAVRWGCDRDTALGILEALSEDEEVLKTILGEDFDSIMQHLDEPEPEPEPEEEPAPAPASRPRARRKRAAKILTADSDDEEIENAEPRKTRSRAANGQPPLADSNFGVSVQKKKQEDSADQLTEEPLKKKRRASPISDEEPDWMDEDA